MGVHTGPQWFIKSNGELEENFAPLSGAISFEQTPINMVAVCEEVLASSMVVAHIDHLLEATGKPCLAVEVRFVGALPESCRVLYAPGIPPMGKINQSTAMAAQKLDDMLTGSSRFNVGSVAWWGAVEGDLCAVSSSGASQNGDEAASILVRDLITSVASARVLLAQVIATDRPSGHPDRGIVTKLEM